MYVSCSASVVSNIELAGCIVGWNMGSLCGDGNNSSTLLNTNLSVCLSATVSTIGVSIDSLESYS